jgi:hypothetical protein
MDPSFSELCAYAVPVEIGSQVVVHTCKRDADIASAEFTK